MRNGFTHNMKELPLSDREERMRQEETYRETEIRRESAHRGRG